jgi:cytochrome oxidase Cu insertion factor (SCO1/SenC/PrrC family)
MKERYFYSILFSILPLVFMVGCQTPEKNRQMGMALNPEHEISADSHFIDFQFSDQNSKIKNLSDIRGQFTVLAFVEGKGGGNSNLSQLVDYLHPKNDWRVRIVGVGIFWQEQKCDHSKLCTCFTQPENPDFYSVCDDANIIRNKYGVKESGQFLIVDRFGKIVAKIKEDNLSVLKVKLDELIDEYIKEQATFEPG